MSGNESGDAGMQNKEPERNPPLIPGAHLHWSSWLALILAVIALTLAAASWFTFERRQHAQATQVTADVQNLNKQLQALSESAAPRKELNSDINAAQQTLKKFGDRLDSIDAALTDLRRRSEHGRDAWIKAEAASLLMAANEQVEINANPELALKALEAADQRLKLLADPRLIPVRQKIAHEETTLRAVPQVDITGMAATLSSLSESADRWPLKRVAPERYVPGAQTQKGHPSSLTLWQRFKAGLEHLLKDIFTVHHRHTAIQPLLEPQQEYFLRQNLLLRLAAARAALLERDNSAFQNSLHLTAIWLSTYFNSENNEVKAALEAIKQMQKQQINPPLPDISASLTLLRRIEPGRDKAP